MKYFLIFLGSGIGGVLRFSLSRFVYNFSGETFPFGTLVVNLIGCFVIGFLSGWIENRFLPSEWRMFVFVGILGGFTTFSSFGLETFNLLRNEETKYAIYNLIFTNIGGILFVIIGFLLSKIILLRLKI
ncbi:MAG: fluoride efflux transporter CrcB [Brevinematales bacterium]|nr:fluoride efflux transporter CrcB [Brevinematales bacterium]